MFKQTGLRCQISLPLGVPAAIRFNVPLKGAVTVEKDEPRGTDNAGHRFYRGLRWPSYPFFPPFLPPGFLFSSADAKVDRYLSELDARATVLTIEESITEPHLTFVWGNIAVGSPGGTVLPDGIQVRLAGTNETGIHQSRFTTGVPGLFLFFRAVHYARPYSPTNITKTEKEFQYSFVPFSPPTTRSFIPRARKTLQLLSDTSCTIAGAQDL